MKLSLTLLTICFPFICPTHAAEEEPLKPLTVFVMAGQSNMVGKRCKKSELPGRLQAPSEKAQFFDANTNTWIPLEPGKTERQGFGPEIAFGAKLVDLSGEPVGIIKHSIGGTNLAVQWDPKTAKSLYNQLARKVESARESRPIVVAGMLWVQGGADSKSEEMATAYAENLKELIERARKDFGNPEMKFISGRIPPKEDSKKPFWKSVRAAQQDLVTDGYRWVDCDDIEVGSDDVHYTAAGMVTLGERQAALMVEMLAVEENK